MSRCLMRGANQACADGPYSERRHSLVCKFTPCDLYKLRADASILDIDSSSEALFRVLSCNWATMLFVPPIPSACRYLVLSIEDLLYGA